MARTLILGAGLAGLSSSYHLGHKNCLVLEAKGHLFGHIHSIEREGFVWDEGPHVSFTSSDYVRELFWSSVEGRLLDYPVRTANYYKGHWIDHPAQSNFYQIPEPLRTACLESFRAARSKPEPKSPNYQEWLDYAFGPVFAREFPAAYTRKYWTVEPKEMGIDWVGQRVFFPKVEDVEQGALGPLVQQTHYIKTVRYPEKGGYQAFARKLADGVQVRLSDPVVRISIKNKKVWTNSGNNYDFERLIVSLPLPDFLSLCEEVSEETRRLGDLLSCSSIDLVEVTADHPTRRPENWLYVYDEDMLSTRINCTELLSPNNAPAGATGVQVEVYSSPHRPRARDAASVTETVTQELRKMGLIDSNVTTRSHHRAVKWGNVIFHHRTRETLNQIWDALTPLGLEREAGDTDPLPTYNQKTLPKGSLVFAGRFGEWKYSWSDDCVLRGKQVGGAAAE